MPERPPLWETHSRAIWVSPGVVLRIPVPTTRESRFLGLDFEVIKGGYVNFDVMLETEDGESATRLYGPSRRAHSVKTCLPLPHAGVAHVTFDNISAWVSSVCIRYTLTLTAEEPEEQVTLSRLRFGNVIGQSSLQSQAEAAAAEAEEEEEEEVRRALSAAELVETTVAAGALEEIPIFVPEKGHIYISFDVAKGRDVDFGVMLLPEGTQPNSVIPQGAFATAFAPAEGAEDGVGSAANLDGDTHEGEEPDDPNAETGPCRLFGPCRRATNLSANVMVPRAGVVVLGFDNSASWIRERRVFFRVRLGDGSGRGVELL